MEIVSITNRTLDSLIADFEELANKAGEIADSKDYALQDWLDNQDVCTILNIGKRTLQTYRDRGKLPFTQIDRKMYYKPTDVEKVLNECKSKNDRL